MPPRKTYAKRPRGRPSKAIIKDDDTINIFEMFEQLGDSLVNQALSPNMLAYDPHPKQKEFHRSEATAKLFSEETVVERLSQASLKLYGGLRNVTRIEGFQRANSESELSPRTLSQVSSKSCFHFISSGSFPVILSTVTGRTLGTKRSRTLHFANGGFIEFKSSDQDTVKHAGTSRHLVLFDEEPPKAIFDENLLRLVDTNGSWVITETPTEGMTWIYFDLYEKKPNDLLIIEVDMDDNPHLSEEAKEKILAFLDEEDRKTRKSGKFTSRGGLIFKGFNDRYPYVIDPWLPLPVGRFMFRLIMGLIILPLYVGTLFPRWQIGLLPSTLTIGRIKLSRTTLHIIIAITLTIICLRFFVTGDPAMKQRNGVTGTNVVQEYGKHGIYLALEGVPRDVKIGLDKMMGYLRIRPSTQMPTWQVTASCAPLIREMMLYSCGRSL